MSTTGSVDKSHTDVALTPTNALKAPSLHTLAAHLTAADSEARVRELLVHVPDALAVAAAQAPVRKSAYPLGVLPPARRSGPNLLLARVLWKRFGPEGVESMRAHGCLRVLGVDVPLAEGRSRDAVPVLCVDTYTRQPVSLELTRLPRIAALFTAIVDGVSHAIALRKAWPHRLQADWLRALAAHGFGTPTLRPFLGQVAVCVMAPADDWTRLIDGARPGSVRMTTTSLQAVHQLTAALQHYGFDVGLAKVEERRTRWMGSGLDVWRVVLPRFGAAGRSCALADDFQAGELSSDSRNPDDGGAGCDPTAEGRDARVAPALRAGPLDFWLGRPRRGW